MKIVTYPSEILHKMSQPVEEVNDEIGELIEKMFEVMYENRGLGLAAIQIGIDKRIFVYDIGNGPGVFINPKVIEQEGTMISFGEGCLSVPGITSNLKRSKKIVVEGLDIDGKLRRIEATDHLARVFQHEIDHLNGTLFIDRFSSLKMKMYEKKLKKIRRYE